MKQFYIYYDETANVNYTFIFCLYLLAELDKTERIYNTIYYKTQKELAEKVSDIYYNFSISTASIKAILNDNKYNIYFSKEKGKIILNNNFKNNKCNINKFVILTDKELLFLIMQNDKLLNKYFLYLKYYIGYTKDKQINDTSNRILSAIGYSTKSGQNKEKLSRFNKILTDNKMIKIKRYIDEQGHCRNIYKNA